MSSSALYRALGIRRLPLDSLLVRVALDDHRLVDEQLPALDIVPPAPFASGEGGCLPNSVPGNLRASSTGSTAGSLLPCASHAIRSRGRRP
jgi:hypothetical protein